jgi:hypothetical protein
MKLCLLEAKGQRISTVGWLGLSHISGAVAIN